MSSYLRRGFIGAVLCLVLALAYQYMIAGRAPLSKAARIATSVPSPKVANMPRAPVIALSHGGGPMPLLDDPMHKDIIASLRDRVPRLLGLNTPTPPKAIVLVTAHWSTRVPTITSATNPSLLYDYYGFPAETYSLKYPAPGSPSVADEVRKAMEAEGLKPALDPKRPWDHGVFVPLLLVNPKADVPVVQVSVLESENATEHYAMGRALSSLRDQNIAVIGSGFASFHNLRKMGELMRGGAISSFKGRSDQWNEALGEVVRREGEDERLKGLEGWRGLPNADEMHPRGGGEHFMPLIVCAGAAGGEKAKGYKDKFLGVDVWTYYWGADEVK